MGVCLFLLGAENACPFIHFRPSLVTSTEPYFYAILSISAWSHLLELGNSGQLIPDSYSPGSSYIGIDLARPSNLIRAEILAPQKPLVRSINYDQATRAWPSSSQLHCYLWVLGRSRIAAATAASITTRGTEILVILRSPLWTEIPDALCRSSRM